MGKRAIVLVLGLVGMGSASALADEAARLAPCQAEEPDKSIAACTAIIDDASVTPQLKAAALTGRGKSYAVQLFDHLNRLDNDWRACVGAEPETAIPACTRLADDPGVDPERRAEALFQRSHQNHKAGKEEQSITDLARSLQPFPDRSPGPAEKALADLAAARALDPASAQPLVHMGNVHMALDDIEAALADFEAAVTTDPREIEALLGRAVLREATGNVSGAVADYKAVLLLPAKDDKARLAQEAARERLKQNDAE